MKKKISIKNVLGVLLLILFAVLIAAFGYRVIMNPENKPGKLCSIPDSANNLNLSARTMEQVQKVTYDTMKYGYMDDLMLAQMDNMDKVYESERMEEVRAVNNLTAMSEKTMDKLAYEKAAKEYEDYKNQARAAALAAENARKAKAKEIADRRDGKIPMDNGGGNDFSSNDIESDDSDSKDSGSGDTASKGGKKGEPVYATSHGESLGTFVITAYCTCRICCGVYSGNNRTASGTVPTSNRTIAVDTNVIPFGTKVVINGQVYVAEDRGGAIKGKRIDMFFMTHKQALKWGRRSMEVFLAE